MDENAIKPNAPGEKSDEDLKEEITERYKFCVTHFDPWKEEAQEDYDFALGDQWTDEDRQALKDQSRPCLTFNRIKPLISIISGYQRENAARIKVNPEGGEDKLFSEFCDRLINAIDKWSHLNYQLGYQFDDGCYCGKSVIEAIITYDKDPIRGEIKFLLLEPWQVMMDPDCKDYNINEGAQFGFKVVRLTKSRLKQLFPKKTSMIDGFVEDTDDTVINGGITKETPSNDYDNRKPTVAIGRGEDDAESELDKDEKFTLKEYWYKKYVKRFFVINVEAGEPEKFKTKDEAESFASTQMIQDEPAKVIEREVPEMWVAEQICGHILQDTISPLEPYYSGFPFFPFIADWAPNAKNEVLRVQGITRSLKDPQREKNKAKSQNLHILNTQANSGWVIDKGALSPAGKIELEEMGSKPGLVIEKDRGSEVREILPKGPNAGMIQREEKADDEIKQEAGVNPDLMGWQEGTQSGKAIGLRVKQAILGLVRLFTNFKYTKETIGNFMLQMVPMMFDTKKAMKVVGVQWIKSAGIDEGMISAWLTMIKDMKYDVVVSEGGGSTLRYETFERLSQMAQAGMQLPPDLLLEFTDIPNMEEVKQRVQQYQQQQQQMLLAQVEAKKTPKPGI